MLVQGFPQKAPSSLCFLLYAAFKAPEGHNDHFSFKKKINSRQSLLSLPLYAPTLKSSSLLQKSLFPVEHLLAGLQSFQSQQLSANSTMLSFLSIIYSICGICVRIYEYIGVYICMYVCVCIYTHTQKYLLHWRFSKAHL